MRYNLLGKPLSIVSYPDMYLYYIIIDEEKSNWHLKSLTLSKPKMVESRYICFCIYHCNRIHLCYQILGKEPNQRGPCLKVSAKNVITCAGFYSDRVAGLTGGDVSNARVVTFRGTYYQLKPEYRGIVRMNIYPVPSGGGIPVGVHLTPTVSKSYLIKNENGSFGNDSR